MPEALTLLWIWGEWSGFLRALVFLFLFRTVSLKHIRESSSLKISKEFGSIVCRRKETHLSHLVAIYYCRIYFTLNWLPQQVALSAALVNLLQNQDLRSSLPASNDCRQNLVTESCLMPSFNTKTICLNVFSLISQRMKFHKDVKDGGLFLSFPKHWYNKQILIKSEKMLC